MYSPEEVPSSDNEYQIGDPTGPFPYAPPGPIRYGTYPEPPEGYNQYQYQEGNKIIREDLGTGRYPNVGPGMIPKGYEIPAPPPLRTPERSVTSPTPTPPSMQSAGYDRDYNRYVGHLDPKYSGASFATPHERFSAGAQTGATQKAITDQFMLRRMQQGGEQHDTLESYAMDKFNPIPKMDLIEFQSMMKNDLGIDDPIRASMPTPLAPSVQAMTEEYDATLTPQYGSSGDPYNLTEARQAANLQATGNSMYTPGVYVTPSESSKYSSQELQIAQEEIEKRRIYNEQYPGGMNTPSYSPTSQQIVNDLNTGLVQGLNKVQQEEGGLTGDEEGIDTGTNTVAGTIAGMLGFMGLTSPTANAVNGLMSTITGKPDVLGLNKSTNALLEFANKNFIPPADTGMQDDSDSGLGPPAGPDVSHSTGEDVSVYGKDGGEVRKYQDGSVGVGSIDPRINPSQGSSSPGMNFINKPGAAPPSKLADDVLIKDEGDVGVREGDVVFPPESVEIMGLLNMNDMIKAALGLALEVGAVVPANIDPNEKVPVRLTNGEVIIPKVVADALGKDRVQEIINKGLKLRAQREEQAQEQQQAPQAAPQAPQAPPQAPQAMPQGLKDGSSSIGEQMDSLLQGAESIYKDVKKNPSKWGTAALTEIGDALGLSQDSDLDTRAREAWSSYHGAEPDLLKEAQFVLHQTGKDDPELRKVIRTILPNYYATKDEEIPGETRIIGDKGLNPTTVEEIMMRIAAHETPGGETRQMIKEKGKLVPKGRARGRLQVEPTTARSMLTEAKELIGPKVQSSLEQTFGVPYNEIQTLSDKEFNSVLQNNPRASVEFGILNLITKLKRDKKLDLIR